MPGKPRPRPQKVLRADVFPLCPFTDPLSSEGDSGTESRGLAYLSDGNTVVDTSLSSRSNDNPTVFSSCSSSTDSLENQPAAIWHDDGQEPLLTIETALPKEDDHVEVHEQGCEAVFLLQPARTQSSRQHSGLSIVQDVQATFSHPEMRPSVESVEQDHCSVRVSAPDSNLEGSEDASTESIVDENPDLNSSLRIRFQSWLRISQDPVRKLSTPNEYKASQSMDEGVFVSANRTAATSSIPLGQHQILLPHENTIVRAERITSTASQGEATNVSSDGYKAMPLRPGRMNTQPPGPSTISTTLGLSSSANPFAPPIQTLTEDSIEGGARSSNVAASYAPLTALKAIFSGSSHIENTELHQQSRGESSTESRTYQNIVAQGSSNNVFGDQITHIHHKQSAAVTAAVATSSASGGFFGGMFATKALSSNHESNPPATTIPLPAPKTTPSSPLSSSILESTGSFLTRMIHGPPPPPDPGPVKIGELTKDCLQALLGGKEKLEPAPAVISRPQKQGDTAAQEMLTRMVAQTLLTAAIPRVTIKL